MELVEKRTAVIVLVLILFLLMMGPVTAEKDDAEKDKIGGAGDPHLPSLESGPFGKLFNPDKRTSILYSTVNAISFGLLMFGSWLVLGTLFEDTWPDQSTMVKIGASFFAAATLWFFFGDSIKLILMGLRDAFHIVAKAVAGISENVEIPDKMFGQEGPILEGNGDGNGKDKKEIITLFFLPYFHNLLYTVSSKFNSAVARARR